MMWFICDLGCVFPSLQCLKKWVNGNVLNSPEQSCPQPLSWCWTSKKCYRNKRHWKRTSLFLVRWNVILLLFSLSLVLFGLVTAPTASEKLKLLLAVWARLVPELVPSPSFVRSSHKNLWNPCFAGKNNFLLVLSTVLFCSIALSLSLLLII